MMLRQFRVFVKPLKYSSLLFKEDCSTLKQGLLCRYQSSISAVDYEKVSFDTLNSLCDYFDEVGEKYSVDDYYDVSFDNGVLTLRVSKHVGTYVINKQTPNKQIWLSSPLSGPKRYDFVNNSWKYSHDGRYLYELLEEEFSSILGCKLDMSKVAHCNPGSHK